MTAQSMVTPSLEVDGGLGRDVGPSPASPLFPLTPVTNRRLLLLSSIRDSQEHAPLAQEIFDELAIAIVEGRLRPGDTLSSVELATRFRTSRTPVREALAELERQGVVVVPARRRPHVAHMTLQQIKNVYDVRAALACLTSELIVEHCSDDRLDELRKWQAALEDDARRDAAEDYFWHNLGFRFVERRLADNPFLERMTSSLGLRTHQLGHLSVVQPGRLERSIRLHRQLLDAYYSRDVDSAVASTRELVMSGRHAIESSGLVPFEVP
jgi:DNA-binding GntR family transcriptional regulator